MMRPLWTALWRRAPQALSAPVRCGAVGSLYDLVEHYPALREVIRHYSGKQFVPVVMNTCSLPQKSDGTLRDDCVVFGLFYVDRKEVGNPASDKVIRQDYFVVWTDGTGQLRYYSGAKVAWLRSWRFPIHWRDIDEFCTLDGLRARASATGVSLALTRPA